MLKGLHLKFWGSFHMVASSFSHIKGGGGAVSTLEKGEAQKVLPCLEGGGAAQNVSDLQFSHFVGPPPRN